MAHGSEIMWIERKSDGLEGPARIGRVTHSKSGRSLAYREQRFESLERRGFKANYIDVATGDEYWISGCHKDGTDGLYSTTVTATVTATSANYGERWRTLTDDRW
jgi:hypothetical protein